jgi:protein subunit release factor A
LIQEEIEESKELLADSKDTEEKKFLQTEISTLEERLTIADDLLEKYTTQFNE